MSKLFLIRHGQASFGHSNYDQLSEKGYQQAEWLGNYFADLGVQPTRIITGDLVRHQQTLEGLLKGLDTSFDHSINSGWNEFDFHGIAKCYLSQNPGQIPKSNNVKAFFGVLRSALTAWANGELEGPIPESWEKFENRVGMALNEATNSSTKDDTVLVISSGGAISMALKHMLNFDNQALINLNLQSRNTGLTECYFSEKHRYVTSFNSVPHLEIGERRTFITSA